MIIKTYPTNSALFCLRLIYSIKKYRNVDNVRNKLSTCTLIHFRPQFKPLRIEYSRKSHQLHMNFFVRTTRIMPIPNRNNSGRKSVDFRPPNISIYRMLYNQYSSQLLILISESGISQKARIKAEARRALVSKGMLRSIAARRTL